MNVISFNKPEPPIVNIVDSRYQSSEGEGAVRRRRALKRVDSELGKGNFKAALSLVKQLKGFGLADGRKVPKNASSSDEVSINRERKSSSLQLLVDSILHSVKCSLTFQLLEEETEEGLFQNVGEAVDCGSSNSLYKDHQMCVQHEAGHFLIGYMLGVLPKRYKVPSLEDLLQDKFAGGKVEFIGFEFLRDVDVATISDKKFTSKKLNNKQTLKKFSCVILGGLVAEHLSFGYSELLHSDVQKLDRVLQWVGLTDGEIDSEVRWAAENAVLILCRHSEARLRLAEAMALGRSVGFCIDIVERTLNFDQDHSSIPYCVPFPVLPLDL